MDIVLKIQAFWRGVIARRTKRTQQRAATLIQQLYRSTIPPPASDIEETSQMDGSEHAINANKNDEKDQNGTADQNDIVATELATRLQLFSRDKASTAAGGSEGEDACQNKDVEDQPRDQSFHIEVEVAMTREGHTNPEGETDTDGSPSFRHRESSKKQSPKNHRSPGS